MEAIIVQDTVIDPFCGSTLTVNPLICICTAGGCSIKAAIPVGLCFDIPPIR